MAQRVFYSCDKDTHMKNMVQIFQNLYLREELTDTTLVCDGGSIKAHKIVLSAGSTFFYDFFLKNNCHPCIVSLKGINQNFMKTIVDFMYSGKFSVFKDQVTEIIDLNKIFQVKGLKEAYENAESKNTSPLEIPAKKEIISPPQNEKHALIRNHLQRLLTSLEAQMKSNKAPSKSHMSTSNEVVQFNESDSRSHEEGRPLDDKNFFEAKQPKLTTEKSSTVSGLNVSRNSNFNSDGVSQPLVPESQSTLLGYDQEHSASSQAVEEKNQYVQFNSPSASSNDFIQVEETQLLVVNPPNLFIGGDSAMYQPVPQVMLKHSISVQQSSTSVLPPAKKRYKSKFLAEKFGRNF